jgi:hypothetical protein
MNFDLRDGIEVLERTPAVLTSLLGGLPSDWTSPNEGPETWSPFDIVGHLIHAEETDWMVRTRIILSTAAERRFQPFVRDQHLGANRGRPLSELLDKFAAMRRKSLADLRALELKPKDLTARSRSISFSPRGWCTTSGISGRSSASWRSNTRPRLGRGRLTCRSSRADHPAP